MNWETGTDAYTLLGIEQIANENLLNSTGNSTQGWLCVDLNGKEIQKGGGREFIGLAKKVVQIFPQHGTEKLE